MGYRMRETGGKLSSAEFDRVILKHIAKDYLGKPFAARRKGLSVTEHVSLAAELKKKRKLFTASASSFDPHTGEMLVYRAALACSLSGKKPLQLTLSMCFPTGSEEKEMRSFFLAAKKAAEKLKLQFSDISCAREETGKPFISVTVFGETIEDEGVVKEVPETIEAEELFIVLVGYPAKEGTILLREKYRELLEKRYPRHFLYDEELEKSLVNPELYDVLLKNNPFIYSEPLEEGGIFGALWQLSEQTHLGMEVKLQEIKLAPLTVEICETLDISPYEMLSGGSFLGICRDADKAIDLCAEAGEAACLIGVLKKGNDKLIINDDERRHLEPFRTDSLNWLLLNEQNK